MTTGSRIAARGAVLLAFVFAAQAGAQTPPPKGGKAPAAAAPAAELKAAPVAFRGDANVARAALERIGVTSDLVVSNGTSALRFSAEDPDTTNPVVLRALLDAGAAVLTLTRQERSLEEAYFAIVSEAKAS